MKLGWLDVCLGVRTVAVSRAFYEDLGFHRVEGADQEGWAVMVREESRIGLFESQFIETGQVTLNFRGGNIREIATLLSAQGKSFVKEPKFDADGSGSATILDPDGFRIFFDSAPGETQLK